MPTQAATEPNTPAVPDPIPGGQQPPAVPGTPSQSQTPQPDATPPQAPDPGIPKAEVEAMIQKARAEEKSKLYPELDRMKQVKTETDKKIEAMETKAADRQRELEDVRAGKVEESETVNRELRELREQNQKLEKTIENVATAAADRVRDSDLKSYRETKIREAGIVQLPELVSGTSEQEIDESVKLAKAKEDKILEKAREIARADLAHDLPKPIAPDGSQGRGPTSVVRADQKENLARLKGDEYRKVRDQLLLEAKQKSGLA